MRFLRDRSKNSTIRVFNWDSGYKTLMNHAGEEEQKGSLVDAIEMHEQQSKQVKKLLKENGAACLEDIPTGARIPYSAISCHFEC